MSSATQVDAVGPRQGIFGPPLGSGLSPFRLLPIRSCAKWQEVGNVHDGPARPG